MVQVTKLKKVLALAKKIAKDNPVDAHRYMALLTPLGVSTTNLQVWATYDCPGACESSVYVDISRLHKILMGLKGEIELTVQDRILTIRSGASDRLVTMEVPTDTMPSHEVGPFDGEVVTLNAVGLAYVAKARSTDPYRNNLRGVYLDEGWILATDGYRMHRAPLAAPIEHPKLISREAIDAILATKPTESVTAVIGDTWTELRTSQAKVLTHTPNEQFPLWRQVWPKETPSKASIGGTAEQWRDMLTLARNVTGGKKLPRPVILQVADGAVTATAADTYSEQLHWVKADGKIKAVGFNAAYLLDAMTPNGMTLYIHSDIAPALVDNRDGLEAVIMPIR